MPYRIYVCIFKLNSISVCLCVLCWNVLLLFDSAFIFRMISMESVKIPMAMTQQVKMGNVTMVLFDFLCFFSFLLLLSIAVDGLFESWLNHRCVVNSSFSTLLLLQLHVMYASKMQNECYQMVKRRTDFDL